MKRTFVEFAAVTRLFATSGVSDDDLRELQRQVMAGGGVVISGAGGLRKIRCAIAGKGKRGGIRVLFADYPEQGVCLFVAAFAKNSQANLSRQEQNNLGQLKAILDKHIRARNKEPRS